MPLPGIPMYLGDFLGPLPSTYATPRAGKANKSQMSIRDVRQARTDAGTRIVRSSLAV
jgi:hypothetical protein